MLYTTGLVVIAPHFFFKASSRKGLHASPKPDFEDMYICRLSLINLITNLMVYWFETDDIVWAVPRSQWLRGARSVREFFIYFGQNVLRCPLWWHASVRFCLWYMLRIIPSGSSGASPGPGRGRRTCKAGSGERGLGRGLCGELRILVHR